MEGVWIVPHKTLKAIRYNGKTGIPVEDQTVWVIEKSKDGYFWGKSYTAIDNEPISMFSFIGSISTAGEVLISFNNSNTSVTGSGKYKKKKFIMQMNTPINGTIVLSHWSYMIHVNKKSKLYWDLPGIHVSVPDFIKLFE